MNKFKLSLAAVALTAAVSTSTPILADGHSPGPMVVASDQNVSNGVVSAKMVMAAENGWMVVHRTDDTMKPGPVVAYAPLRKGENYDVAAILKEPVASGEKLMLMVHSEAGGNATGVFEYTLGAVEDGPIRMEGELVMTVITAR